jgi:azurin
LPTDYYLDYTLTETIRQLKPWWRQALADGQPVATQNPAGLDYLVQSLTAGELLKLPRTEAVQRALLTRPGVADALRAEVLLALAQERNQTRVTVLLNAFDALNRKQTASMITLARMFPNQPPAELAAERSRIAKLTDSHSAEVRQSAWAALMIAAGSLDAVWDQAGQSSAQADLLAGLPLVLDQDLRNAAHARVESLLAGDVEPAVRLAAIRAAVSMPQHQAATFTALTRLIAKGEQVPAAAAGLRTLPRAAWSKDQASNAAAALVAWARTVPADQRTSEDYIEAVQAATELAGLLPAGPAEAICGDLKGLRVAVYVIRTVREQMRYDTPRIVVTAGKPFELRIENTDFMPHNLVVVKPGAREKIGAITEKMKPETLDAQGRAFVPDRPEILAATALLEAGQKATLKLTAPAEEGDYEYVCTFPGHWQVMWGRLVVTRDVDAYLAQHPRAAPTTTATAAGHKHAEYE